MGRVDFSKVGDLGFGEPEGQIPATQNGSSHALWLSSGTFSRVDPTLYFDRHIRKGVRPGSVSGFMEFRSVHLQRGSLTGGDFGKVTFNGNSDLTEDEQLALKNLELNTGNNCFGSSVVRSGRTTVVAGIIVGTTETEGGAGIYVNVEVLRGGFNSPPSPEEMVISQKVSAQIKALKLPEKNFQVIVRVPKESLVEEEEEDEEEGDMRLVYESREQRLEEKELNKQGKVVERHRGLVLTVHVQVLSRTGPPHDLVWTAVMGALQDFEFPEFIKDDAGQLYCVERRTGRKIDFGLENIPYSSTFGITTVNMSKDAELFVKGVAAEDESIEEEEEEDNEKVVVVADPDGEIEESCLSTQMQVTSDSKGILYGFSFGVVGNVEPQGQDLSRGLTVNRQHIESVLEAAQARSGVLEAL